MTDILIKFNYVAYLIFPMIQNILAYRLIILPYIIRQKYWIRVFI